MSQQAMWIWAAIWLAIACSIALGVVAALAVYALFDWITHRVSAWRFYRKYRTRGRR